MAHRSNPPVPPFRRKIIALLLMVMVLLASLFSAAPTPAAAQEAAPPDDPAAGSGEGGENAEQPAPEPDQQEGSDRSDLPDQPAEAQPQDAETPQATEAAPGEPEQPLDPMSQEEPGEAAPASDITVPPQDTYEGQEPYEPPEILWSSVAAADRKLGQAMTDKRAAIDEARRLRRRLKELGADQQKLDDETVTALAELTEATTRLQARAVVGYQRFGSGSDPAPEITISDYQDVVTLQRRSKLVDSALVVADADIEQLDVLRTSLNTEAVALLDRARIVSDHLADAVAAVEVLEAEAEQAAIEYEAFKAGSEIFIHGVTFPIAGQYDAPFDSYGFPRMPGTPDEHWHEGIDLFAARGTPLVATERGVITKLGTGRLGGLKFWLKGESGSEWYYAHLDSFAPGLTDGLVVEAGQLLGYVGNTGNAVGTPPHLHMQLHPDGGDPVNPYPLLKVVSDLDQAAIAAGTHPGYEYQSHLVAGPVQTQPAEPAAAEPAPAEVPTTSAPPASTGEWLADGVGGIGSTTTLPLIGPIEPTSAADDGPADDPASATPPTTEPPAEAAPPTVAGLPTIAAALEPVATTDGDRNEQVEPEG